ncbi:hypothetical protein N665_0187s0008 [Sinapis alba]|nr:hypothetical protein N665_0187s0008 [Sinapis alba]
MVTQTSHTVYLILSMLLLRLFISSQVGVVEAIRYTRPKSSSNPPSYPMSYPPPGPPSIYFPPSKSRRGRGP